MKDALRVLYPQVIRTEDDKAFDINGNEVLYDINAVNELQKIYVAESNRRNAYIAEADPLFFKAQRGEATMEEWEAKVTEIKNRYPKQ
jgi:hypothetical protein